MNIDFFTLGAQIINLLVLLFLLRKFLYLPVLKVLEERKTLLENEYAEAEKARKKAELTAQKMQKEYALVESEKQQILADTHEQAQELALKLSNEAQEEFKNHKKQWKNKLLSEQNTFELALQKLTLEYFSRFTDGALMQMADISLNELFIHKLEQKLTELSNKQKAVFERDFLSSGKLEIATAKELNAQTKKKFSTFLRENFALSDNFKIQFIVDENLICGISLKAKEQILEWNLADYIADFTKNLNEAVAKLINKE